MSLARATREQLRQLTRRLEQDPEAFYATHGDLVLVAMLDPWLRDGWGPSGRQHFTEHSGEPIVFAIHENGVLHGYTYGTCPDCSAYCGNRQEPRPKVARRLKFKPLAPAIAARPRVDARPSVSRSSKRPAPTRRESDLAPRAERLAVAVPKVQDIPIPDDAETWYRYRTGESSESRIALRREYQLVSRFKRFLEALDLTVTSKGIDIPDGGRILNDLWVEKTRFLIEAKARSDRVSVRMGIGQIFDYERFLRPKARSLLLPDRPASDLLDLLRAHRIGAIWPEGERFVDETGSDFTG